MACQVFDICETYKSVGIEQSVQTFTLVCKTLDGQVVENVKHEFYLAVSLGFSLEAAFDLGHELNEFLLNQHLGHYARCNIYGLEPCVCPKQHSRAVSTMKAFNISTESCLTHRRTDRVAVKRVSFYMGRGFTGYEPHERKFVRFELTRSYYATGAARKFLLEKCKTDSVHPIHRGCYEMMPNGVNSFLNTNPIKPLSWLGGEEQPGVVYTALCFDIETLSRTGYCYAERGDPVCLICTRFGDELKAFMLGLAPVNEPGVLQFETELEMLEAFRGYVLSSDPDFIVGFNSDSFDFPYVCTRLRMLGSRNWNNWSRLGAGYRMQYLGTKEKGMDRTNVYCPGRVFLDVLRGVEADASLQLESRKLNDVAEHLGFGSKGDVAYEEIWPKYHGTAEERDELIRYCHRDVDLTWKIFVSRKMMSSVLADAKVYTALPRDTLNRGISSSLMRVVTTKTYGTRLKPTIGFGEALHESFSCSAAEMELRVSGIVGGLVIRLTPAFYDDYILVLDFNSLYPSLIRRHNICHSTWVYSKERAEQLGLTPDDYYTAPSGAMFVKQHILVGFIPGIVAELVQKRTEVKAEMENVTDKGLKETLNSMQLAFKTGANSMYGGLCMRTGGKLALMVAGEAVTTYGRAYIEGVIDYLHTSPELREFNPRVFYGDTDSCMVLIRATDVEDARQRFIYLQQAVNEKSGLLQAPMKVGRDSMSLKGLFLVKKGYALGEIDPTPGKPIEPKLKVKGLAFVRRDRSKYVRECGMTLLKMLLLEGNQSRQQCFDYLRGCIADLLAGRVDRVKLRMSSRMNKPLDEYRKNALTGDAEGGNQVAAVNQLVEAGIPVEVGDHIRYYFCVTNNKGKKVSDKVVAERFSENYQLDLHFYAERFLSPFRLLAPLIFGERCAAQLLDLSRYQTAATRW